MSGSFTVSWVGGDYQNGYTLKDELPVDIRQEDFILDVPFEEKDDVKSLGGNWNRDLKKWVVPRGKDINKFKKWHPQPPSSPSPSYSVNVHRKIEEEVVLEDIQRSDESLSKKKIDMNMGFSSSDEEAGENEPRKQEADISSAPSALTAEQKRRIEQNRLEAMEKRRFKLLEQTQSRRERLNEEVVQHTEEAITASTSRQQEKKFLSDGVTAGNKDPDVCRTCNERPIDIVFRDAFNELVCNICKAKYDEFKLHNKAEIKEIYLLTDSSIRLMKCLMKDNPHNSHWAQMKLYLAKHGKEKSIERWGSEEALEEERNRRKKEQYAKDLEKASKVLTSAGTTTKTEIDEVEDGTTNHLSKMLQAMKDNGRNELNDTVVGEGLSDKILQASREREEGDASLHGKTKGSVRRNKGPTSTQSNPKKARTTNRMANIMTGNY